VQAMEKELRATKAQLQAATDELETRIQDMRTTTEEFQAVNEELQSSNEELETAKEEMQSINEELQTINSELNNKNELLTRLNSDMQNLLDSTQIATIFLDSQLRIRHFTPALTQLFPLRDTDRGRTITQIVTDLDYTAIQADVIAVQRDGSIVERDLALKNGERVFVMRIRPYRTPNNVVDGVVITFVDITERKHAEERQKLLTCELQHRTNNLLAVVQSVAGQSLSGAKSLDQARAAFTARLHALANANALLTQADWKGAPLKDVITRELVSFVSRTTIEGPPVLLNVSAAQGFALVIHELATNAAKYGALSTPAGMVAIRWSVNEMSDAPQFSFSWQESGGPPVGPPGRKGFGTLLKSAIGGADATPGIEYAPKGVRYTLEAPLSAVATAPLSCKGRAGSAACELAVRLAHTYQQYCKLLQLKHFSNVSVSPSFLYRGSTVSRIRCLNALRQASPCRVRCRWSNDPAWPVRCPQYRDPGPQIRDEDRACLAW
jgi:two-component system CheB/CheR fusion protein